MWTSGERVWLQVRGVILNERVWFQVVGVALRGCGPGSVALSEGGVTLGESAC